MPTPAAPPAPIRFGPAAVSPRQGRSWPVPLAGAALVLTVVTAVAGWAATADDAADTNIPVLVGPGISDDFTRDEDPAALGDTRTGQPWDQVSGTWLVRGGAAVVDTANEAGARTAAVVDLGSADGAVAVTARQMVSGLGVLFRYQDPFNYWFLTAAPAFGTWKLQRLQEGEVIVVGSIGLAAAADGTTVEVRFEGRTITTFIDGAAARQFSDPALEDATGVGILVEGPQAADAAWDDFVAVPSGDSPSTTVYPS